MQNQSILPILLLIKIQWLVARVFLINRADNCGKLNKPQMRHVLQAIVVR